LAKAQASEDQNENGSDLVVNSKQLMPYHKPARNRALLEIRRLLVDHGYSHQQIMIELNLPPTTYFRYLNLLFEAEQQAIAGNNRTYETLLTETLLLQQRYLAVANRLTAIGDDKNLPAGDRIEAHIQASYLMRACHDFSYLAPSFLARQKLIPPPSNGLEMNLSE
jgi:hypothetical protein